MKKLLSIFSACAMMLCLGGCGNSTETASSSQADLNQSSEAATAAEKTEDFIESSESETEAAEIPEDSDNSKILVAYFSATGTTKIIAETIADEAGADIFEIVPAEPYSDADLNYHDDSCRANREQNDDKARPEMAGRIDVSAYDTIFVGYPIWWGQAPKILYTFMESADFSGKTLVPFCTSGSSGIGTSAKNLSACAPEANWLEGKRFSGSAKESEVTNWIEGLEIAKKIDDGFVEIKGGTFTMGSPEDEPEREADEIQHDVTVGSFYLAPTVVPQKEYTAVMGVNNSEKKGDDLPVTNVTWYDAINYCNTLSRKAGLKEAYKIDGTTVTWDKSANGYRLPTEAEWEFAARVGSETPFYFGDYVHDNEANCYNAYGYNNDSSGHWVNDYLSYTVAVRSYPANANGLYEIHGNTAEWVWDWYSAYDVNSINNPTGAANGNAKVARGGAYNDMPKHIRSAYRSANPPDVGTYGIGFRVARGAVGTGTVTSKFNAVERKSEKKVLIAYFSQTGNTQGLTDIIAEMTGADVFHIERAEDYSAKSNSQALYNEALMELREFAVPDLKTALEDAGYNIDDYDTILLGYCNWWASIPAPVHTFVTQYNMDGKTIIPYCSMGGGRFGQTISAIAKLATGSNIGAGLDITYSSYDRERIERWLKNSGII